MDIYSEIEYPISPGVACERLMGMLYSSNKIHIEMAVRMETKNRLLPCPGKQEYGNKCADYLEYPYPSGPGSDHCRSRAVCFWYDHADEFEQSYGFAFPPVLADIRRLIRKPSLTDWLTEVETV